MPPPHNYNLRISSSAVAVQETEDIVQETGIDMATGFRLEKFRGDDTDDVEEFIKKFDRYCNVTNLKNEQKLDLMCLHLEGRASWYVDNLATAPADLTALKAALTNKFKVDRRIKMDIFSMKKMDIECNKDFVHRVDKETLKLKLPEKLRVQIAVDGLETSVRSVISSHGPKTLDEFRVLADRVQASASVNTTIPQQKDDSMQQILSLLQTLVTLKSPSQPEPKQQVLPRHPNQRQPFHPSSTGTPRPIRGRQPGSCWRCGGRSCSPNSCPAMGKTCHFCLKPNHFQSVCNQALGAEQQKQHTQ